MREGLTFDDVLLVPGYNQFESRADVDTSVQMGPVKLQTPFLSSNMDTVTGHRMARAMHELGGFGVLHRFFPSIEENVAEFHRCLPGWYDPNEDYCAVSVGVRPEEFDRAADLREAGARIFCVDIAHAHTQRTGKMIKHLREELDSAYIIAGNVATYDGARYLIDCGADAIKIGVGPGSACTTRIKTGCGVPQLTAIQDCSRLREKAFLIADGGIRTPGDAVKALAAGAHAVMLGGFFAGADETPGEIVMRGHKCDIRKYKVFRGMASKEANDDHNGGLQGWKTAEGASYEVEAKGPVADIMHDLVGGLRSGMTYVGAANLTDLATDSEFIRVSSNGVRENGAHGEGRL